MPAIVRFHSLLLWLEIRAAEILLNVSLILPCGFRQIIPWALYDATKGMRQEYFYNDWYCTGLVGGGITIHSQGSMPCGHQHACQAW